jgi:transposase
LQFKCLRCGLELNADLHAARNIAQIGISMLGRLFLVDQPNVTNKGTAITGCLALTGSSVDSTRHEKGEDFIADSDIM